MGDRSLPTAAVAFAAGWAVHNVDHLRRGTDAVTRHVLVGGLVVGVLAVAAVWLVLAGHRLGPFAAVAVGLGTAVAVGASHLLPEWSAFSDALPGGEVDGLTWAAVLAELAGAVWLGLAGLASLRRSGFAYPR
jgi:hypothetical protein